MAVFFFVVGMEIKRELTVGELSSVRKASLPAMAAFGGMVVPALIYVAFIISGSGPRESTLFYAMYIYNNFTNFRMGLASAMAWVLFLIIALFTYLLFRTSARWVYYGGGD